MARWPSRSSSWNIPTVKPYPGGAALWPPRATSLPEHTHAHPVHQPHFPGGPGAAAGGLCRAAQARDPVRLLPGQTGFQCARGAACGAFAFPVPPSCRGWGGHGAGQGRGDGPAGPAGLPPAAAERLCAGYGAAFFGAGAGPVPQGRVPRHVRGLLCGRAAVRRAGCRRAGPCPPSAAMPPDAAERSGHQAGGRSGKPRSGTAGRRDPAVSGGYGLFCPCRGRGLPPGRRGRAGALCRPGCRGRGAAAAPGGKPAGPKAGVPPDPAVRKRHRAGASGGPRHRPAAGREHAGAALPAGLQGSAPHGGRHHGPGGLVPFRTGAAGSHELRRGAGAGRGCGTLAPAA